MSAGSFLKSMEEVKAVQPASRRSQRVFDLMRDATSIMLQFFRGDYLNRWVATRIVFRASNADKMFLGSMLMEMKHWIQRV